MKRIFRIIISISVLVIAVITAVFLVWPEYREYASLRAEVQAREARLESGESVLAQLKKTKEEVELHEEDFVKIDEAIPKDAGLPVLYGDIQQLGATSGLVLLSVAGQPAGEPTDDIAQLVFHAEFLGFYDGLKGFLDALNKSARILNISALDVSVERQDPTNEDESPGELRIDIELLAYEALL